LLIGTFSFFLYAISFERRDGINSLRKTAHSVFYPHIQNRARCCADRFRSEIGIQKEETEFAGRLRRSPDKKVPRQDGEPQPGFDAALRRQKMIE